MGETKNGLGLSSGRNKGGFEDSIEKHLPLGTGIGRGCSMHKSFLFPWLLSIVSFPPFLLLYKLNLN